jgi:hypothetical protein
MFEDLRILKTLPTVVDEQHPLFGDLSQMTKKIQGQMPYMFEETYV